MAGIGLDLKQAINCARIVLTLYGTQAPPRRLLDHLDHLERLARGFPCETEFVRAAAELKHDLIGADEAASIIGCSPQYVRRIHTDLDGQRIAGRWVFERKAIQEYAVSRNQDRYTA